MADESVSVELDTKALQAIVDEFALNYESLSEIMPAAASVLVGAVDYEFHTEGRGRWKKSKRAEEQGGKTLQDTGILAGSIQPAHGDGWFGAYTETPYAVFHLPPEKSGVPSKGIMPVRDFLDIDMADAMEEVADLIVEHLVQER